MEFALAHMQISDIMITDVITVSPDETVAKALSLMVENRVHQLPVLDGNYYVGMVYAKNLIEANVFPRTTKISSFVVKTPSINPAATAQEASQVMIKSGLRALPVIEKDRLVGIITEVDLVLDQDFGKLYVDHVMHGAIVIPGSSSLSSTLSKMKRQNISRLPVIDANGRLIGGLDTLDIAEVLRVPKERKSGSRTTNPSSGTERVDLREVQVKDIMHRVKPVETGTKLSVAINVLNTSDEIIVTENNMPIGILTPKDIMRSIMPEQRKPMIQISHVDDEGVKNEIITEISKFLKHMKGRFDIIYSVEVAVDRHKNRKYSMRGKLMTTEGLVTARSVGWDVRGAARELMNRLGRRSEPRSVKRATTRSR